jgi:Tfp pilus assembly protein PilX
MPTRTNYTKVFQSERGFALVTAILACVILLALAILILDMSTNDLRVSGRTVGEKKAMNAAETGIQFTLRNFDAINKPANARTDVQVDATGDPSALFSIVNPRTPDEGNLVSMAGFGMGGSQSFGRTVTVASSIGRSNTYNTHVEVEFGVAHGPVDVTTMSR